MALIGKLRLDGDHTLAVRVEAQFVRHLGAAVDGLVRGYAPGLRIQREGIDGRNDRRRQIGRALEVDKAFNHDRNRIGQLRRGRQCVSAGIGVDRTADGIVHTSNLDDAGNGGVAAAGRIHFTGGHTAIHVNDGAATQQLQVAASGVAGVLGCLNLGDLAGYGAVESVRRRSMDAAGADVGVTRSNAIQQCVLAVGAECAASMVRHDCQLGFVGTDVGRQVVRERNSFAHGRQNGDNCPVGLKRHLVVVGRVRRIQGELLAGVFGGGVCGVQSQLNHVSRGLAAVLRFIHVHAIQNGAGNEGGIFIARLIQHMLKLLGHFHAR